MSTIKADIKEKMEEASSLLSNLSLSIFGSKSSSSQAKQKKPKEMVETIKAYLAQLQVQQQNAAMLAVVQAAQAQAAAQQAALTSPSTSPSAGTTNGTTASATNPASSSPSISATTSPVAVTSNQTSPSQQQQNANSSLPTLTIPSPANSIVMNADGTQTTLATPTNGVPVTNPSPSSAAASSSAAHSENPITSDLDQIVTLLYGDASIESTSGGAPDPRAAKEVIDLMFEADLFRRLLENIRYLEFEARKFFTRIFEYSLTQRRDLSVPYILQHSHILYQLIHGYEEKDVSIALACDAILRACIQCEPVTELMCTGSGPTLVLHPGGATQAEESGLTTLAVAATPTSSAAASLTSPTSSSSSPDQPLDMILSFFHYLSLPTFINSHAFSTFKLLFQCYPQYGAAYLQANYEVFFSYFNKLLKDDINYLTKCQAFSFLGELLIERLNQTIMMRYVNEPDHLKLAMMALRGPKAIQLAVFNVLKVFVPNPYKAESITRILTQNKKNFLGFLAEFEKDSEDETLIAHKEEMRFALENLPDSVPPLVKKSSFVGEDGQAVAQQAASSSSQPNQ